jgi:hypothetical protein
MNGKHTPGPWKASDRFPGVILDDHAIPRQLASVAILSDSEQDANARLIAAAPDLLEQLKNILARFENCARIHGNTEDWVIDAATEKARAVIAKATGEEQA